MRLILGLILVLGGAGGIENNHETLLPLDSLSVIMVGFLLLLWFIKDVEDTNEYN